MGVVVCLVGMCGSGKSVIADMFVKKNYKFFRFGQITLDLVKERGLEPTEENERSIREEVRKKHGMGAYAILNIPRIEGIIKENNVVGDGLYSWEEYKILKEKYGEKLIIIALYSSPETRYERLSKRIVEKEDTDLRNRPISEKEAKSRDYAEIENLNKGGPIAMADYTILNNGTLEELKSRFNEVMEKIK